MEEQEINWAIISLFALIVGVVAIWLLQRNFRDKKHLQQKLDHESQPPTPFRQETKESDT
jgi:uncharacterized membrane-anchored protein YhcB (DUF1043 family)